MFGELGGTHCVLYDLEYALCVRKLDGRSSYDIPASSTVAQIDEPTTFTAQSPAYTTFPTHFRTELVRNLFHSLLPKLADDPICDIGLLFLAHMMMGPSSYQMI